jgi:choline dehydrogenase
MYWPRGKVLGGSSSINAMVYVRGHPNDFNEWGAVAPGWSWKDLEPYFRKMENWKGGPDQARGGSGPLSVTDVSDKVHPLTNIYLKAASQLGFPVNTDYNSTDMEGANIYQTTTDKGFRASAYTSYLRPVKNQVNIQVLTNAHAKKILLKGKKSYRHRIFSQR